MPGGDFMKDENRFFRWVWRFNGVVLALAVIALIVIIAAAMVASFQFRRDWMADTHLKQVPKAEQAKYTYRLAEADLAALRHHKLFLLHRSKGTEEQSFSSYRSDYGDEVNLMLVDGNGTGQWVFRGNERLISARNTILETAPNDGSEKEQNAIGFAITVIDADTNGDGKLTAKDRQTLYGYLLGGEGAVKLMTADEFLGASQFGTDRYVVVYAEKDTARSAVFSLPGFKLISDKPLPNVPK